MQRVPNAGFEPALQKRLEELWGKPVNLYRALGNHPAMTAAWTEFANAMRVEMDDDVRDHSPRLR